MPKPYDSKPKNTPRHFTWHESERRGGEKRSLTKIKPYNLYFNYINEARRTEDFSQEKFPEETESICLKWSVRAFLEF